LHGQDGDRSAEGEPPQLLTAGPEGTQADRHGEIGIEEVVEEVEDEDGCPIGASRLEQVQELVAGEGTGEADAVQGALDFGGVVAEGGEKAVGGEAVGGWQRSVCPIKS
jgi:hypothetical protein